jgi:stress response protein SCP2
LYHDVKGSLIFFVISSNSPAYPLSSCQWLAVDIYVSAESLCHRIDGVIELSERFRIPYFKQRISPLPIRGATLTIACALSLSRSGAGLQAVSWNAPSQACRFAPFSVVEILPELAAFAGLSVTVPRRLSPTPALFCLLKRGLALHGFREWVPVVVSLESPESCDLTLSALLFGTDGKWLESVSLNRPETAQCAIRHSGDGPSITQETLTINCGDLPADVSSVVICLNRIDGSSIHCAPCSMMSLRIHGRTECFRMKLRHASKMIGFLAFALARYDDTDWNIIPIRRFVPSRNTTETKPYAADWLRSMPRSGFIATAR